MYSLGRANHQSTSFSNLSYILTPRPNTPTPYSKFKVSRGGGRHFSRDIAIDHQMENLGLGASGSEEDSSSEEESEPETNTASPYANVKLGPVEPEMTRAERKAMKKVQAGKGKGKGESGEEGSEEEEEALPTRDSFGPSRKEKYVPARTSRLLRV